jgi:hypothetical protein
MPPAGLRFQVSGFKLKTKQLFLAIFIVLAMSCSVRNTNDNRFTFGISACDGPMQAGVDILLANKNGKIVHEGRSDITGHYELEGSRVGRTNAVLFCKEGFECSALPSFDFGFEHPDDTAWLNNGYGPDAMNLAATKPEEKRSAATSEYFSIKVRSCESGFETPVYGMKMFFMMNDGRIICINTVPVGKMQDFKIYKDTFYDARIMFLCGPGYYCSATIIDSPGFFEKNEITINMAPFIYF